MPESREQFLARIGAQPGDQRALKYDPAFCELVRDLGQEGKFQEEWASRIGVTLETMRLWRHRYPDFRDALVIAHQLLITYWTNELAKNRNSEGAKPGMYQMILRRFPAIYGKDLVDLQAWLMAPVTDAAEGTGAESGAITADQVKAMSDDEIRERIEILRRRREAEAQG